MVKKDRFRDRRERDIANAVLSMGEDDGDSLPSGRYVYRDGKLVRIGDTRALLRYHGTPKRNDKEVIREFVPSTIDSNKGFGPRPALDETPATYSTSDISSAEDFAFGLSDGPKAIGSKPHVYTLVIAPSEIVNLDDCLEGPKIRHARSLGADALDCPDYWEQPETITFDPRITHIRNAINIENGKVLQVPPKPPQSRPRPANRRGRGQRRYGP